MKPIKFLSLTGLIGLLALTSCTTNPNNNSSEQQGGNSSGGEITNSESSSEKDTSSSSSTTNKPNTPDNSADYGTYYNSVSKDATGAALKSQLHNIISKRNSNSYKKLWEIYKDTDIRDDGKIMDIYSNTTNYRPGTDQAGNYKKEGDVYNREHCIPKSWWGDGGPQESDPFIVLPSDGYVNNIRNNYAFGEVDVPSYQSNNGYSKLGSSKYRGPSVVFEPADEWKGDMARIYFYALTCYDTSYWTNDHGNEVFSSNGNFGLTTYASKLFLKWHKQDPVSAWEQKRCNKVQRHTRNRNPFIDHPEYVEKIWGNETF